MVVGTPYSKSGMQSHFMGSLYFTIYATCLPDGSVLDEQSLISSFFISDSFKSQCQSTRTPTLKPHTPNARSLADSENKGTTKLPSAIYSAFLLAFVRSFLSHTHTH